MTQLTGRAYVSANGVRFKTKNGSTLNFGGPTRTTQTGDTGVLGYTETITAPSVSCSIAHDANTSLTDLRDMKDVSITFEADTGKIYTISPAWLTNPPTVSNGEVQLVFEGMEAVES